MHFFALAIKTVVGFALSELISADSYQQTNNLHLWRIVFLQKRTLVRHHVAWSVEVTLAEQPIAVINASTFYPKQTGRSVGNPGQRGFSPCHWIEAFH